MKNKNLKSNQQQKPSVKQHKASEPISKLSVEQLDNVNGGWWAQSSGGGNSSW